MGAKQKPIPLNHDAAGWARDRTAAVLASFPAEQSNALPRALLEKLALIAFHGEGAFPPREKPMPGLPVGFSTGTSANYAGTIQSASVPAPADPRTWASEVVADALAVEFGFTVEFMARVRTLWYRERGALGGKNLQPQRVGGLIVGRPETARQMLRWPEWREWETNRRRTHYQRQCHAARYGFKVTKKQWAKAFEEFPAEAT